VSLAAGVALAERGLVPTPLLRRAIRGLCRRRLIEARAAGGAEEFLGDLAGSRIAEVPELANSQHYEVPGAFYELLLGAHRKYSCALWTPDVETLDEADLRMLDLTCERAGLEDGQDVLELGCGWGSVSLFMARRYPASRILAVSNSRTQRAYIEARRPANLEVLTADMNDFEPARRFDRVVSVEMFEHMRDWRRLLARVAGWLTGGGRLFVHVFCHATSAYAFEARGEDDWIARNFFSGGIMPSFGLLPRAAAGRLVLESQWWLDGTHYERTAAAWRRNLESRRTEVIEVLRAHYGPQAGVWYRRWRMFLLACEELFAFSGGREWGVGHYRLARVGSEGTRLV
jgi:cyclopropane-fatty-acyl-phospholipid synthase